MEYLIGGKSALSGQERDLFNQQFTIYEGSMSGSQIKSLLNKVVASNAANNGQTVTVNTKAVTSDTSKFKNSSNGDVAVVSMKNYTVKCNYTNGVVSDITITLQ